MNKKILRTLTALCAALVLMGGFSVTAFAQTPEGEDDTNDSGVVYEEPQKEEPLTPDGNATLVDDFGGNKQLITVTTKNGNYFYILIDRDDEGENTVCKWQMIRKTFPKQPRPPFAVAPKNAKPER